MLPPTVMVMVELPAPGAGIGLGLKLNRGSRRRSRSRQSDGAVEATADGGRDTSMLPDSLGGSLSEAGEAEIVKLGWPPTVTVSVTVWSRWMPPPLPVTVMG